VSKQRRRMHESSHETMKPSVCCHSLAALMRSRRPELRHSIEVVCPDLFPWWRRFIQFDPIVHKLSYDVGKLSKVCGFSHITIRAKTVAIDEILLIYRRRKYRHRYELRPVIGAHAP